MEGDRCLPANEVACGAGTNLSRGECVPIGELVCGEGTVQAGDECVPSSPTSCGEGTRLDGANCVAAAHVTCGPGTHLVEEACVIDTPHVAASDAFSFDIAERGGDIVYFLDSGGGAVHRYDLAQSRFLEPYSTSDIDAAVMAVGSDNGVYVGSRAGRINRIDAETGQSSFLGTRPNGLSLLVAAGSFLFAVEGGSPWSTHSTTSLATGKTASSADWRFSSRDGVYAPSSHRLFWRSQGVSPVDLYFVDIDPDTGALGADRNSPYHGDFSLGDPIRLSPDESKLFVSSGIAFNTDALTYDSSLGLTYRDLAFGAERLYVLRATSEVDWWDDGANTDSEVVTLTDRYEILSRMIIQGRPLRLFAHGDQLTTFTRQGANIVASESPL